jgi:FkbM family methyltransferase
MSKINRFLEIYRDEGALSALVSSLQFSKRRIQAIWDKNQRASLDWEERYRYEYDIGDDDVIIDLGGYRGNYTERLLETHSPDTVHVFEPVPRYADEIRAKFSTDSRVVVHEYGLKDANGSAQFEIDEESSSLFTEDGNTTVEIRDIVEVLDELSCQEIELVKINVEGAEYALLDRLIESGYVTRINNLLIQFHDFPEIENAKTRRTRIQQRLRKTHEPTFIYYFIWESWQKK